MKVTSITVRSMTRSANNRAKHFRHSLGTIDAALESFYRLVRILVAPVDVVQSVEK